MVAVIIAMLALLAVSAFTVEKQGEVFFLDAVSDDRSDCFALSRLILESHASQGAFSASWYAPSDFNLWAGTAYFPAYACGYFGVVEEGAYARGDYRVGKQGGVVTLVPA